MKDPLLFGLSARHQPIIQEQVLGIFRAIMFKDIAAILKKSNPQAKLDRLVNAGGGALRAALQSGRVQYEAGIFSGKFSAAISKDLQDLGARFNKRSSVYELDEARVPAWVKIEATVYQSNAKATHDLLLRALDDTQENLNRSLETKRVNATLAIGELESGWKAAATVLEVNPELSHGAATRLNDRYDENMKLSIRGFADEQIPILRQIVRENAAQGYRFDRLIPQIEARYDVSKTKATFLARQETSLLVSKFREERFRETVGDDYTWMTSHDSRVRPATNLTPAERLHAGNHRVLDGKVFSYTNPPIVDPHTGRRANPGEDYNCRCVARPVLKAREAAAA